MKIDTNQEVILPKILKPKQQYDLVRIGKDNDGGYLVSKQSILESQILISAGTSWDFSFEKEYINLTGNNVKCFDHTINVQHYLFTWLAIFLRRTLFFSGAKKIKSAFNNILKPINFRKFIKNKNVEFFYIGVGLGDKRYMSLKDIIKKYSNQNQIFLKIDIEGDEYRLMDDLLECSDMLSGLIIEFHYVDLHLERIISFLNKINLTLIHTHANNAEPITNDKVPSLIECSFAKNPKDLGVLKDIKHKLDQPNIKSKKDYNIKFI